MAAADTFGQAPHGRKRAADSGLESEQRLSKRLDLLHLADSNARLYVPVPGSADGTPAPAQQRPVLVPVKETRPPSATASYTSTSTPTSRKRADSADDDLMQVEDTPHRVYIHDLNAELADIESDEERPVFLPDIEKHIAKIPDHVLRPELKPSRDNQLILYSVPSSLTLPEEQDRVRKAILEARARLRERQASPVRELESARVTSATNGTAADMEDAPMAIDDDADAMDIDG